MRAWISPRFAMTATIVAILLQPTAAGQLDNAAVVAAASRSKTIDSPFNSEPHATAEAKPISALRSIIELLVLPNHVHSLGRLSLRWSLGNTARLQAAG